MSKKQITKINKLSLSELIKLPSNILEIYLKNKPKYIRTLINQVL